MNDEEKINLLGKQLDTAKSLHQKELQKVRRYEQVLCVLLNQAEEDNNDEIVELITNAFNGLVLDERYEQDALEGTNLLGQLLNDTDE